MPPRARRPFSTNRAEIRRMLRETVSAESWWDDQTILDAYNVCKDVREMELMDSHEGWSTERNKADLVAGQNDYPMPEGTGRVKRVLRRWSDGTKTYERPLRRDEMLHTAAYRNIGTGFQWDPLYTYRLLGSTVVLTPAPTTSETDGLVIEHESLGSRIVNDSDVLDLRYPDVLEELLNYDTWDVLLGQEESQAETDQRVTSRLKEFHETYAGAWRRYIAVRSFGMIRSRPFSWGD